MLTWMLRAVRSYLDVRRSLDESRSRPSHGRSDDDSSPYVISIDIPLIWGRF